MHFEFSLAEPPYRHLFMRREAHQPDLSWVLGPDRWQLFYFCLNGTLRTGPRIYEVKPGSLVVIPPRSRSELRIHDKGTHAHYHINFTPVDSARDVFAIPQHSDLSTELAFWDFQLKQTLDMLEYSSTPAIALLWQLLWRVAVNPLTLPKNPMVVRAEEIMRARLRERVRISDLARELFVSAPHLAAAFRAEHGTSPKQYSRQLCAEETFKLLTSTVLPIKRVAVQVGMPNLHQFNRFCREMLGASPRAIRNDRQTMDAFAGHPWHRSAPDFDVDAAR